MKLLVTLLIPIVAWAAQYVRLPGLDPLKLELFSRSPLSDPSMMSVMVLGLAPALSGFVLVELAALAVPRWRGLRDGNRPALRRAAVVSTVALAAIQASFVARFIDRNLALDPGLGSRLLLTATMVGGTCFMLALAWLISRHGLANGFSILLAAPAVPMAIDLARTLERALDLGDLDPPALVLALASTAAAVAATRWILRARSAERAREPTSGIVPLVVATSLLRLPAQLANLGIARPLAEALVPGSSLYALASLILVVGLGVLFSRLFEPGANFRRTIGFLIGMTLIPLALARARIPLRIDLLLVITATAVVIDLVDERRARRRHPGLVAIGELHRLPDVAAALAALEEAGIPRHARAAHHRALLHFFGPYLPVEIFVPADRAEEARSVISLPK